MMLALAQRIRASVNAEGGGIAGRSLGASGLPFASRLIVQPSAAAVCRILVGASLTLGDAGLVVATQERKVSVAGQLTADSP